MWSLIDFTLSWNLANEANISVLLVPTLHEETTMWLWPYACYVAK